MSMIFVEASRMGKAIESTVVVSIRALGVAGRSVIKSGVVVVGKFLIPKKLVGIMYITIARLKLQVLVIGNYNVLSCPVRIIEVLTMKAFVLVPTIKKSMTITSLHTMHTFSCLRIRHSFLTE